MRSLTIWVEPIRGAYKREGTRKNRKVHKKQRNKVSGDRLDERLIIVRKDITTSQKRKLRIIWNGIKHFFRSFHVEEIKLSLGLLDVTFKKAR